MVAGSDDPELFAELGRLEARLGEPEAARAAYRNALDLGVSRPVEVLVNFANLHTERLQDHAGGKALLEEALKLDSASVPALLNLGNLHEDEGDRDAAATSYLRALEHAPEHPLALSRLAGVTPDAAPTSDLANTMRRLCASPAMPAADRSHLGFGLGKLLDRAESYDEAFGWFEVANRAAEAARPRGAPPYDPGRFESLAAQLGAAPLAAPEAGDRGAGLIFICGAYRSGSTLLEQILGGHSDVTSGGELPLLRQVTREHQLLNRMGGGDASDSVWAGAAAQYLDRLEAIRPGWRVLTDKHPDNILLIGVIRRLLPAAKVVITQRDARDCGLSIYMTELGLQASYATDLGAIGHYLGTLDRLGRSWLKAAPAEVFPFSYDGFIARPEPTARVLLNNLGLAWEDECLAFHKRRNPVQTASVWQVRQPLYASSVGRWRNYDRHLSPLYEALARF